MTDTRTVYDRVVAIIDALPAIDKTQRNEQQGFMFRGHDDVLNALNPLLAEHGVFVVPDVLDRVVAQRTTSRGSVMFEVNLHVRFTFYGAGGDSFSGSTWGEGTDMGDKATSKAMTMAFKSMLNQAFAISNKESSDPDGETPEPTAPQAQPVTAQQATAAASPAPANGAGPSEKQIGFLNRLLRERNLSESDLPKPIAQLTKPECSKLIEELQNGTFVPATLDAVLAGGGEIDSDIPFEPVI